MQADSKNQMYIPAKTERGFTLLELLISITLVAVIIVILSMALKTGLRAWIRGHENNRHMVAVAAIQGLLGKQLLMAVRPGVGELARYSRFSGEEDELIFTTTYTPMGAQAGGIFLVIYRFLDGYDILMYAQRIVTNYKQIKMNLRTTPDPDEIGDLREQGWEVSLVPGINSVSFSYVANNDDVEIDRIQDWPTAWFRDKSLPKAVGMVLELKNENTENSRTVSAFFEMPEWKTVRQKQLFRR